MTEVAYGQFLDVMEEFTFPKCDSAEFNNNSTEANRRGKMIPNNAFNHMVALFFHAMERVNNSQLESSDSLASISSQRSMSSGSIASMGNLDAGKIYQAFQVISLNHSGSNNSVSSLDEYNNNDSSSALSVVFQKLDKLVPGVVRQFICLFDDFMQNHIQAEEASAPSSSSSSFSASDDGDKGFPKFC